MRSAPLLAAFAALSFLGLAAPARAQTALACGSGYHPDPSGGCQSNVVEANRYCPAGSIYHAAPNGYFCETPDPVSASAPPARPLYRAKPARAEAEREAPASAPRHAPRRVVASARSANRTRALTAPLNPAPVVVPVVSGGGGGGGGGGGWSDRRLKRDIVRLGVSPSGLPIYAFQYVWGGPRYIGVMAQDLLTLRPDAVTLDGSGYYRVDYSRIDVKMREEPLPAL